MASGDVIFTSCFWASQKNLIARAVMFSMNVLAVPPVAANPYFILDNSIRLDWA